MKKLFLLMVAGLIVLGISGCSIFGEGTLTIVNNFTMPLTNVKLSGEYSSYNVADTIEVGARASVILEVTSGQVSFSIDGTRFITQDVVYVNSDEETVYTINGNTVVSQTY